jgi:GDP-L-fucose synthase
MTGNFKDLQKKHMSPERIEKAKELASAEATEIDPLAASSAPKEPEKGKDPFPTSGISFFKDKICVVTGATGLIGSYVVKVLVESGAIVRAIVHTRLPNEFTRMAQTLCRADLSVPSQAIEAVYGASYVFGCAGITGGINLPKIDPVSYVGPATAIAINTLHACHVSGVNVFGYLSSTTVYPPSDNPVKEADVHKHISDLYHVYRGIGFSKRFLENLCTYYSDTTKLGVGIIRPAGAYGRFDNFDEKTSHVLPGLIQRAAKLKSGEKFVLWGDGEDVRDFIHAQDIARCLLLASTPDGLSTPFNACSGIGVTTRQLAEIALKVTGKDNEIQIDPTKPSALKIRRVDGDLARQRLGFQTEISLEAGMADVAKWLKAEQQ